MSSSPESIVLKQPIRRLEIQISNFNVAIPHHVDLLKRHKSNIKRYEAQRDWEKVQKEDINVSRIIKQLKELLYQMDTLRSQVLDSDINQFDKLTASARTSILTAITEYMELQLDIPLSEKRSVEYEDEAPEHPLDHRYVQLNEEQEQLEHQQACLHSWNNLQSDMQQLHELFVEFNKIVDDQKELVSKVEDDIEETQVNVNEGERFLQKASRYKIAAYPLAGAFLGTCLGGPIGLLAGLKIGGLAALSCGILGFTGGSLLKKKEIEFQKSITTEGSPSPGASPIKMTVSMSDNRFKEDKKNL